MRLAVFLCIVGVVVGGPPLGRSREDIEAFRNFLENSRKEYGVRLEDRITDPGSSAWVNSGKFEGDIILDDEQVEDMVESYAAGRNAYTWPNTKWPEDTIVYEFGEGEFDSVQEAAIMAGIEDIEKKTCIKFRLRQPGERVYVRLTGRSDGCYAHVGYWESRGVHTFNLARNVPGQGCFRHTTIIHEWLHIIGFLHMQSTYNRDDYVKIMWENIMPGTEHNFNIYSRDLVSNLELPYDYASCMHYPPYGFSVNGEPTIVALHDFDGVMGQQEYVTDWDWLRVNRHYECPGAWDEQPEDK